jgi:translocator protein
LTAHGSRTRSRALSVVALGCFLALSAAVAFLGARIGAESVRTWYPTLAAPSWQPPSWVFGPVWTTLYTLMAIAVWRVWRRRGFDGSVALYLFHLMLNAAWTGLFFGLHRIDLALIDIVVMDAVLAATVVLFWAHDRLAGVLLAPTLVWGLFATYLNVGFWILNR